MTIISLLPEGILKLIWVVWGVQWDIFGEEEYD
jgi:hypothetical protein